MYLLNYRQDIHRAVNFKVNAEARMLLREVKELLCTAFRIADCMKLTKTNANDAAKVTGYCTPFKEGSLFLTHPQKKFWYGLSTKRESKPHNSHFSLVHVVIAWF